VQTPGVALHTWHGLAQAVAQQNPLTQPPGVAHSRQAATRQSPLPHAIACVFCGWQVLFDAQ
jgi:hypothetical protein